MTTGSYLALIWPGEASAGVVLGFLGLLIIALGAVGCLWRLFFHPLRDIPGPKLAAITDYYRFYFDTFGDGMARSILELHKQYNSPVIRIGPNYIHVNDPVVYHDVFARNSPFLKWHAFWHNQGGANLILSVTDPKQHRAIRAPMNPFFSRGAADNLSKSFVQRLQRASDIMAQESSGGASVDLLAVIRSLTCNTMAEVFFGETELVPTGQRSALLDTMDMIGSSSLFLLNFPIFQYLGAKIPARISESLAPGLDILRKKCDTFIRRARTNDKHNTCRDTKPGSTSLCEMLLDRNPAGALTSAVHNSLMQHALQFLVPNTDSSAVAICAAVFQIAQDPEILGKLRQELGSVGYESGDWGRLARLPYLSAIVKETLRMYPSLPGLLPRVIPAGGYSIDDKRIPEGTTIAVSIYAMHQNAEAYPDPNAFIPERWLSDDDNAKQRDRCFVPFQKGNHMCIGMNLAYMQLFLGIAHFVKRFDMRFDGMSWEWYDRAGAKPVRPVLVRVDRDYYPTV